MLLPRCGQSHVAGDWSVPIIILAVQQPSLEVVTVHARVCRTDDGLAFNDGLRVNLASLTGVETHGVRVRLWHRFAMVDCGQRDVTGDWLVEIILVVVKIPSVEHVIVLHRVCRTADGQPVLNRLRVDARASVRVERDGVHDRLRVFMLLPLGAHQSVRGNRLFEIEFGTVDTNPSLEVVAVSHRIFRRGDGVPLGHCSSIGGTAVLIVERDRVGLRLGLLVLLPVCGQNEVACDRSIPIVCGVSRIPAEECVAFTGRVVRFDSGLALFDRLGRHLTSVR